MTLPQDSNPTITVEHASQWFGSLVAVNDVSFEVTPGITGLLGPNGAGKTTLLRALAGQVQLSGGRIRVLGQPVRNNPEIYRSIGVMPEHEGVYDFLTGRQFVELQARLQGLEDPAQATAIAIQTVDLEASQDRRLAGYSRGMRQRMRLAATLVHRPSILLLDEPLSGADPRQRLHFQDVLRQLAADGHTVLISSHILEEVEAIADRIILMVAGKLAAIGDYRIIRQKLNDRPYELRVECDDPRALGAGLLAIDTVESIALDEENRLRVRSRDVTALQHALPRVSQQLKVRLLRVEPLDDSLESVFAYLSEG